MSRLISVLFLFLQPFLTIAKFDLSDQIFKTVEQQLAPIHGLDLNIQNQVKQALMPIRAMAIKNSMRNGIGGTTIATYYGNIRRSFIIKDGYRSTCNGRIVGPHCYGTLQPFKISTPQDYCYAKSYAYINGQICLTSGNLDVHDYNGDVTCRAVDGSPRLFLTKREYHQLCGNRIPLQIRYRYYANLNDKIAISIPNRNPYIGCLDNKPGVCDFEADARGSTTVIKSSSRFNYFGSQ